MSITKPGPAVSRVPTVDLNELCLDHPGASYIFQVGSDLIIVDCAAEPHDGCLVAIEEDQAFSIDLYHGQDIFGVITHRVQRLN